MNATEAPPPAGLLADLPADGPHPDLHDHADLFGQFIGVWDMDIEI